MSRPRTAEPRPTLSIAAGGETAWPVRDVLAVLSEATGILLDKHNYDQLGWERFEYARRAARAHIEGREPDVDSDWMKTPVRSEP